MTGAALVSLALHEEVLWLVEALQCTTQERKTRSAAINCVANAVAALHGRGAEVVLYGSAATNTDWHGSDVDLLVAGVTSSNLDGSPTNRRSTVKHLYRLADMLSMDRKVQSVVVLRKARVPIIKCCYERGVQMDISYQSQKPILQARDYVLDAMQQYAQLPAVLLVLKVLLQQHQLDKVYSGGLSSWVLTLLLIAHCQEVTKSKPSVLKNAGALLCGFLHRYGCSFDYSQQAVAPALGGVVPLHALWDPDSSAGATWDPAVDRDQPDTTSFPRVAYSTSAPPVYYVPRQSADDVLYAGVNGQYDDGGDGSVDKTVAYIWKDVLQQKRSRLQQQEQTAANARKTNGSAVEADRGAAQTQEEQLQAGTWRQAATSTATQVPSVSADQPDVPAGGADNDGIVMDLLTSEASDRVAVREASTLAGGTAADGDFPGWTTGWERGDDWVAAGKGVRLFVEDPVTRRVLSDGAYRLEEVRALFARAAKRLKAAERAPANPTGPVMLPAILAVGKAVARSQRSRVHVEAEAPEHSGNSMLRASTRTRKGQRRGRRGGAPQEEDFDKLVTEELLNIQWFGTSAVSGGASAVAVQQQEPVAPVDEKSSSIRKSRAADVIQQEPFSYLSQQRDEQQPQQRRRQRAPRVRVRRGSQAQHAAPQAQVKHSCCARRAALHFPQMVFRLC